jgi:hypothetical protein
METPVPDLFKSAALIASLLGIWAIYFSSGLFSISTFYSSTKFEENLPSNFLKLKLVSECQMISVELLRLCECECHAKW